MTSAGTQSQTSSLPSPSEAPELHDTLGVNVDRPDAHTDASLDDAVAAIDRPQKIDPDSPDWHEGLLPKPLLPSFGEENEHCGEPTAQYCAGCGGTHTIGDTCDRLVCPRCCEAAIRERAIEICSRLAALRAILDERRDPHQRFHHVAISPPVEWLLLADTVYETTVDVLKELMNVMGLVGWYAYHPYAGKDGDDRGAWKQRLGNERDWEGDVRNELIHRPHFHAVVIGHKVPGGDFTRDLEDETGWIVARITPKTAHQDDDPTSEPAPSPKGANVSIYGNEELARAVTYILSHTGLEEKETPNGTEHHLMANYFGSTWSFKKQEPRWWPEVATVQDDRRDEWDADVRAAAPTTLGVAASKVQCHREHQDGKAPGHDYEQVDVVASAARSQASGNLLHLPQQRSRTSLPTASNTDGISGTVNAAADAAGDNDLPEPETALDGSQDDYEHESDPEPERCRGRLLHIAKAHRHLEDDDWLANAPHAVQTLTAYQRWTEENPGALDNVDTDAAIASAEDALDVG